MKFDEIIIDPKNQQITVKKLVIDDPHTVRFITSRKDVDYILDSAINVGTHFLSKNDPPEVKDDVDGVIYLANNETDKAEQS